MADFEKAIPFVLKWEGGYVNDADDSGGETYQGISRKHNPKVAIWRLVDAHKPLKNGQIIKDPAVHACVKLIYRLRYWDALSGDKIADQQFAGFFLDWYINSGSVAVKKLQELLGLQADGVAGPVTLAAINAATNLYTRYRERRIQFYRANVKAEPKNAKFLRGWLNRVNDYR